MFYLVAVILLNTVIFTEFKLFPSFRINSLQATTVNYWTCLLTGIIAHGYHPFASATLHQPWALSALLVGAFFIFLFNFMAYSTATHGITVTTIANKLSLVIPVVLSFWLYHERATWLQIVGIALALPAVFMATKQHDDVNLPHLLVPAGIFVLSGISDTALKYIQHTQLSGREAQAAFTITMFTVAAFIGTLLVVARLLRGKDKFSYRNVSAGILLGIPNYFSIYYLVRLFDSGIMPSSCIIPVNNIGIVISTGLVAILFFKEDAGKLRIAGILLALLSIILIAASAL